METICGCFGKEKKEFKDCWIPSVKIVFWVLDWMCFELSLMMLWMFFTWFYFVFFLSMQQWEIMYQSVWSVGDMLARNRNVKNCSKISWIKTDKFGFALFYHAIFVSLFFVLFFAFVFVFVFVVVDWNNRIHVGEIIG